MDELGLIRDSIDLSPKKVKCVISKGRSLKKRKERNWKRGIEVCWTRVSRVSVPLLLDGNSWVRLEPDDPLFGKWPPKKFIGSFWPLLAEIHPQAASEIEQQVYWPVGGTQFDAEGICAFLLRRLAGFDEPQQWNPFRWSLVPIVSTAHSVVNSFPYVLWHSLSLSSIYMHGFPLSLWTFGNDMVFAGLLLFDLWTFLNGTVSAWYMAPFLGLFYNSYDMGFAPISCIWLLRIWHRIFCRIDDSAVFGWSAVLMHLPYWWVCRIAALSILYNAPDWVPFYVHSSVQVVLSYLCGGCFQLHGWNLYQVENV